MSEIEQTIERIAKNVGCDTATVTTRMVNILSEQQEKWVSAGKNEEQCNLLAMRVAGRQIKTEMAKAKRSGCVIYEGMFLTSPRHKDWAEYAYKKMKSQLETLSDDVAHGLVEQGKMVLFEYDPTNNGYTKYYNPSLNHSDAFVEGITESHVDTLPKEAVEVNSDRAFYLIWNNNTPYFPSGDRNFKYGNARPKSEKERTCLFFGRKQGSDNWASIPMRFSNTLAEVDYPTYIPGSIAVRPNKDGTVAYGKPSISVFAPNEDLASAFPADPEGIVNEEATQILKNGLEDLPQYIIAHKDDKDWYDQWVAFKGEVVHVEPRDNGDFVMTVGGLDFDSMETTDVYIPASQESLITFSVGSEILLVGQGWMDRDGEARFTTQGWFCAEEATPVAVEGWD